MGAAFFVQLDTMLSNSIIILSAPFSFFFAWATHGDRIATFPRILFVEKNARDWILILFTGHNISYGYDTMGDEHTIT